MPERQTERLHPMARGLDALPAEQVLRHLLAQQQAALSAVSGALPALATGAGLMARTVRNGGRLIYAGAGSSALMAIADGLELHGTYGVPNAQVELAMAGGLPVDSRMPGDTEDNTDEGAARGASGRAGDTVIAVTASGSTPYPLALARAARERGASVIGIANNPDAELFSLSDVAVCLETPPEVVAGSTRMGAGTAQKAALNLMSTLMGVMLGQVHDGMMVGLVADNAKLRARAAGMVAEIAGVDAGTAGRSLDAAGGAVKPAVLIARGLTPAAAARTLAAHDGRLRRALDTIAKTGTDPTRTTNQGRNM